MKIIIDRIVKNDTYTIGEAYLNGTFYSYTMEDKDRGLRQDMTLKEIMAIKIKGKTAIPTGTYNVAYTYSPKFKRKLPLVENVKGYSGIRIHPLNTAEQSEGCIGFGLWPGKGRITNSADYTNHLVSLIEKAVGLGKTVTLEIH